MSSVDPPRWLEALGALSVIIGFAGVAAAVINSNAWWLLVCVPAVLLFPLGN